MFLSQNSGCVTTSLDKLSCADTSEMADVSYILITKYFFNNSLSIFEQDKNFTQDGHRDYSIFKLNMSK